MAKLFYTIAQLSNKQSMTPEGYLLCEDVPIARTGEMIYGGEELQTAEGEPVITPDDDGLVRITRSSKEVFRPETLASFNGKSVTDDHPQSGSVSPDTWKELTVGTILNPRQGVGVQEEFMLADLLITHPEAIEAVRSGKREVSCGYEADYVETSKGEGEQRNIIGNHVALVEKGRCGWRCAIGDKKSTKELNMSKKLSFKDRILSAFHSKDEEGVKAALEEMKDAEMGAEEGNLASEQHIHVHIEGAKQEEPAEGKIVSGDEEEEVETKDSDVEELKAQHEIILARLAAIEAKLGITNDEEGELDGDEKIEGQLEAEAPVGTGERAKTANDSAFLVESYQQTVALAEILSPGFKLQTFDHAAKPAQSFKKICGMRRESLDLAYAQPATRTMIEDVMGGKALDTKNMTCDAIRTVFKAVGAIKRAANNDMARGNGQMNGSSVDVKSPKIQSVRDINKAWDEANSHKFN